MYTNITRGVLAMGKIEVILANENLDEMTFYLDYVDILIDFFEKREIKVDELYEEKRILTEKIEELSQ
jgi:hypothetical protein